MQTEEFTFEKDKDGNDTFPLLSIQDVVLSFNTTGLEHGKFRNLLCGQVLRLREFNMDIPRMERAIQKLYDTDDALRTILVEQDGKIFQRIVSNYKYELVLKDTVGSTPSERLDYALKEADRLIETPQLMGLNRIMSRIDFYKIDENDYLMLIYVAHILVDGVAVAMAMNKIFRYYNDINTENKAMSYSEYRRYETEVLNTEEGRRYTEHYKSKLEGYSHPKHILDGTERPNEDYTQDSAVLVNKAELDKMARSYKTSPFFLLHTAYNLTLAKYYGITDTVTGIVLANRQDPKYTQTVGLLCKGIAVRVTIHPEDTFRNLVAQVVNTANEDTKNQIFATYALNSKYFSSMQRENSMAMRLPKVDAKLEFQYLNVNRNAAGIDRLALLINEVGENTMVAFTSDSNVYSKNCILKMSEYYQQAINAILHNPDGKALEYLK